MTVHPSPFLRRVLAVDALASGATGLLMTLGADLLERLLALPAALLFYAGLFLLPYAAVVGWMAARPSVPGSAIWAVIACNAAWAADSLLLLASGWVAPNALGHAFVIVQAVVVALFAELQYLGIRRSTVAPA